MDYTSLNRLIDLAVNEARALQPPVGVDALTIPTTHALVDLEKFRPQRSRFRGKLETSSLADFVTYVKRRSHESIPRGFIDGEKLAAVMFFNLGTPQQPGHADDRAVLQLKVTAPFAALLGINGKQLDQDDLIDFLRDWRPCIEPFAQEDGGIGPTFSAAVAAIRKVKITAKTESEHTVGDFRAARSAMEEVEATSTLELPGGFFFTCEPYAGLPQRSFTLRLSVNADGREPVLRLRIVALEAEREAIAQDFKAALMRELDGGEAELTIGTFTP